MVVRGRPWFACGRAVVHIRHRSPCRSPRSHSRRLPTLLNKIMAICGRRGIRAAGQVTGRAVVRRSPCGSPLVVARLLRRSGSALRLSTGCRLDDRSSTNGGVLGRGPAAPKPAGSRREPDGFQPRAPTPGRNPADSCASQETSVHQRYMPSSGGGGTFRRRRRRARRRAGAAWPPPRKLARRRRIPWLVITLLVAAALLVVLVGGLVLAG